jgi:hypothetical protein
MIGELAECFMMPGEMFRNCVSVQTFHQGMAFDSPKLESCHGAAIWAH